MDRMSIAEAKPSFFTDKRLGLIALLLVILGILGYKMYDAGWFLPHTPLAFNNQPALLFFNRHKGCDCAKAVYSVANLQVLDWTEAQRSGVQLIKIDLDRRPDLGDQYQVLRAPSLLLVDSDGQVVFRQDYVVSDSQPLDMAAFEKTIRENFREE